MTISTEYDKLQFEQPSSVQGSFSYPMNGNRFVVLGLEVTKYEQTNYEQQNCPQEPNLFTCTCSHAAPKKMTNFATDAGEVAENVSVGKL